MAVTETDGQTDRRADGQRERAVEAFRRRVERGDYGELFDEPVRAILEEAGAERGLVRESGALRLTLARLLAEEEDAVRLSLGVSRVATASARVERTLHVMRGGDTELEQWLGEMLAAESRRVCEEADERAEAAAAERERERRLRERIGEGRYAIDVGAADGEEGIDGPEEEDHH